MVAPTRAAPAPAPGGQRNRANVVPDFAVFWDALAGSQDATAARMARERYASSSPALRVSAG